ncbi:hypothetical protein ACFO3J_23425 [Streptomyces polygonati]|uniref:DUF2094 domain-containing protein n=1 Tax=Streptomyces polygonati TaxID=1617087 RepID=A0ABV8HUC8_9ACTN
MRYAGSSSWLMRIGSPQGLLIGLFVRDAAGLHPRTVIDVPRLVPAVELRADLAPLAVPEASAQWARWWERELARQGGRELRSFAPDAGFGDGREFGGLVRECLRDAVRWCTDRSREETDALTRGDPHPHEGDLVRLVEEEIGRKARPFELQVTELPVEGSVGWRVSSDHVVVSRALRADPAAYRDWLTPVVRELA